MDKFKQFEAWVDSEFSEYEWYCEAASLNQLHKFQDETQSYYCDTENDMWMAWQHRQARIDELEGKIDAAYKSGFHDGRYGTPCEHMRLREERDELQKRVDAVQAILADLKKANYMHSENKAYNSFLIEKLEQALKGKNHE